MSKLVWDKSGERYFETGVSHGVLYPKTGDEGAYAKGTVWNGLTAVNENPSGAEANAIYADNIKYLNLISNEEFEGSIEAYTYPDEFSVCDGSVAVVEGVFITSQERKPFGLSYQTKIGSDENADLGYKLHLVYNAVVSPTEKSHETVNDTPEADTFSWDFTTTPVEVTGYKPTAHLVIDSRKVDASKLNSLKDKLYGTESQEPTLLSPEEVIAHFKTNG